jgi:RHS repeat-associated protein
VTPAARADALISIHPNVTALVSASGTISNDYRFDPWGTSIVASSSAYNPFGYISAYRHPGLANLYHMGARWYQPASGRFTQLDPHLKKLLTVNRYAHAGCDPVNKSDPSGLHEEYDAWDCAVGVLAGYSLGLAGLFVAAGGIVLAGGSITL